MADRLVRQVEGLKLEGKSEDQVENNAAAAEAAAGLYLPGSSTITMHTYLRRKFFDLEIIIQLADTPIILAGQTIQTLKTTLERVYWTLTELALYSEPFKCYELSETIGTEFGHPFRTSVQEFLPIFFSNIGLNSIDSLIVDSMSRDDLTLLILKMVNLFKRMYAEGVPFHLWPVPQQLNYEH